MASDLVAPAVDKTGAKKKVPFTPEKQGVAGFASDPDFVASTFIDEAVPVQETPVASADASTAPIQQAVQDKPDTKEKEFKPEPQGSGGIPEEAIQKQTVGPKSKNQPTGDIPLENLMRRENDARVGWDANTRRWHPHPSIEVNKDGSRAPDTIGYGHVLSDLVTTPNAQPTIKARDGAVLNEGGPQEAEQGLMIAGQFVPIADGLTEQQALDLLKQDTQPNIDFVNRFTRLTLTQKAAIVSMLHRVGLTQFNGSKAKKALEEYQDSGSRNQLEKFIFETWDAKQGFTKTTKLVNGVPTLVAIPGVVNRAKDEEAEFRGNTETNNSASLLNGITQAARVNPDKAVQTQSWWAQLGLPSIDLVSSANAAEAPIDDVEFQAKIKAMVSQADNDQTPITRAFAEQPEYSIVAQDDIESGNFSTFEQIANQFKKGQTLHDLGKAGFALSRNRTPENQAKVEALQQRAAQLEGTTAEDTIGWLGEAAMIMGQMLQSFVGPEASVRTVTGATIGGATGLAGGPLAPVTVPAGAVVGGVSGLVAHMGVDAFEVEAGLAYLDLIETGIDHDTATWLSLGVGTINAALELAGASVVVRPLTNTAKAFLKKSLKEAMGSKNVLNAARKLVTQYGAAVGAEVGTEVLQEVVNIAAEEIGKAVADGEFEDFNEKEALARIEEIALKTMQGMAILAAVPTGGAAIVQSAQGIRQKARQANGTFTALHAVAQESKTKQRAPETAAEFRAAVVSEQGIDSVSIPIEEAREILENASPEAYDIMQRAGMVDQVTQGKAEIHIDGETFASTFIGENQIFEAVAPHLKVHQGEAQTPSIIIVTNELIGAKDELIAEAIQAPMKQKTKEQVLAMVEKFKAGEAVQVADLLAKAPTNIQNAIEQLMQAVEAKKKDVSGQQIKGRVRKLDADLAAVEADIARQAELIEEREEAGRSVVAANKKLDKLVAKQQDIQQEQADLLLPKAKAGKFEETRKEGVTKSLRNKEITTKAGVLEKLNIRTTRESIRAARKGFQEGLKAGRKSVREGQRALNTIIDKSGLKPAQRDKFRRTVSSITSVEDLQKKLPVIQARVLDAIETQRKKELSAAIKKVLKQNRPKTIDGKPVGKLTPAVSRLVKNLRAFARMSPDEAMAKLSSRLGGLEEAPAAEQIIENQMLAMIADPTLVTSEALENILIDLNEIIAFGKLAGKMKLVVRLNTERNMRQRTLDALGAVPPKPPGAMARALAGVDAKFIVGWSGAWWNKLQRVFNDSNATEVNALIDDLTMQNESDAYDTGKNRKIRRFYDLASAALGGMSERRMLHKFQRDATVPVKLGQFTHSDGTVRDITMTRSELRKRFMEMQTPQLKELMADPRSNAYTPEIFDAIQNALDHDDRMLIKAQLQFYREYYIEVNAAYEEAYGVSLPKIENYSPIKREFDNETIDEFFKGILHVGSVVPGSVKSRNPSLRPLKTQGDVQVLHSHIMEMEYFIAFHAKVRLLNAVFMGDSSKVLIRIQDLYGKEMAETIRNDLKFFAKKNVMTSTIGENFLVAMLRNFGVAQLAISPQIMLKQLVSFAAFSENVPVTDFTAGMVAFAANPRKALRLLNETDYFKNRGINIDHDFSAITSDSIGGNKLLNFLGRHPTITKMLMLNIRFGDKTAIAVGGYAHVWAKMKNGATKEEALASFRKLAKRTQQSTDPDQRSELQRGNAFMRLMVQFLSSANALARAEYSAIIEAKKGRITKRELAKRLVVYHLFIPNLLMYVANGFEWDDDDQMRASILGSANGVFILGEVIAMIVNAATDADTVFGLESRHPLSFMDDIRIAIQEFSEEDISVDDWLEGSRAIDRATRAAGALSGIPFNKLNNMLRGAAQIAEGDTKEGAKLMLGYSPYVVDKFD